MRIVVCVKLVTDTAARIQIQNGQINSKGLAKVLNPYDEFAVEEAIRIREHKPDTVITLVSLGPENFQDALRAGLAMGADNAIHLMDPTFDTVDSLTIARLLAKVVAFIGFDLILCGRQAIDDDMAQIGPALGVYLDIPCVTVVTKLDFEDDWKMAKITRQIEGGSEIIGSPLPVLVTCQKGLNQPRLPSLKGIMTAKKKEIQIFDAEKIGLVPNLENDQTSTAIEKGLELPPTRDRGTIFDGPINEVVSTLVKTLRETEKVV